MREWLAVQCHILASPVLCWFQIAAFNHVCGSIWYQSCTLRLPGAPWSPNVFLLSYPISCHLKWLLSCVKTERESRRTGVTPTRMCTTNWPWRLLLYTLYPTNTQICMQTYKSFCSKPSKLSRCLLRYHYNWHETL